MSLPSVKRDWKAPDLADLPRHGNRTECSIASRTWRQTDRLPWGKGRRIPGRRSRRANYRMVDAGWPEAGSAPERIEWHPARRAAPARHRPRRLFRRVLDEW